MRYRKKPVEVEAIQWTGENYRQIHETFGLFPHAEIGDYVVYNEHDGVYIETPDIFKETYEEIE